MSRKASLTYETEKEIFPTRLREVMQEQSVNQKTLAKGIGVRPQTVSLYTTGQSAPDVKTLKKISDFFNISSDYLLGISTAKSRISDMGPVCAFTGLSEEAVSAILKIKECKTVSVLDGLLRNATTIFLFAKMRRLALLKIDRVRSHRSQIKDLTDEKLIFEDLDEYTRYTEDIDITKFRLSNDFQKIVDDVSDQISANPNKYFEKAEVDEFLKSNFGGEEEWQALN